MERAVARGQERRQEVVIPYIGIGEKSFGNGHDCATIALNPARQCVHDLGRDRTLEAAVGLLERCLPDPEPRLQVSAAVIDISAAFAADGRQTQPSAAIVYNRFHVSKLLNPAVDQVQQAEHKRLTGEKGAASWEKPVISGSPARKNLSPRKREQLESLSPRNSVVERDKTAHGRCLGFKPKPLSPCL